jgi:hypothetical protein
MLDQLTNEDCSFCSMCRHELDHVAVLEDKDILVLMDLYPATPGHDVPTLPRFQRRGKYNT